MAVTLKNIRELIEQQRFLEQRTEELKNLIATHLGQNHNIVRVRTHDIITSIEIENLVFKFYQNSKMPTVLFDNEGQQVFSIGIKKTNSTDHVNAGDDGCCKDIIEKMDNDSPMQKYFFYQCPGGYSTYAIPVEVRGKLMAILMMTRFVLQGEVPGLLVQRNPQGINGTHKKFQPVDFDEMPVFSGADLKQIIDQSLVIAEMISFVATKNLEFKERFRQQVNIQQVLKALDDKVQEQETLIKLFSHKIEDHHNYILQNFVSRSERDNEMRQLTRELDRNDILLNSLLTSVPLGIGFVKKDIFTYVNDEMFRLTGYTPKELVGRPLLILIEDKSKWNFLMQHFQDQNFLKEHASIELKIRTKRNLCREVMAFIGLADDEKPVRGFTVSFLDITDIKNTQRELTVAKEKAEESDHLKNAFLTNMSHEIRTPLNSILGFSELICSRELSPEQRIAYSDIVQSSGHDLVRMIDDLVDLSKLATHQMNLDPHGFSLHSFLMSLLEVYKEIVLKKCSPDVYIVLKEPEHYQQYDLFYSDELRLKQILSNLLNNGLKYTQSGKVEFGYQPGKEGHFLEFYVKDSGEGIRKSKLKNIFSHFPQDDDPVSDKFNGTGLGLAISKSLVELMGGSIRVESTPGKGTCFYFTLPAVLPARAVQQKYAVDLSVHPYSCDWSDKTILVAEDEEINYLYISNLLASTNINIQWVQNGQKAVDYFNQHPEVNIVLMDIKMPVLNGIEATRQIKSINHTVPVIAQTAYAHDENRNEIMKAGCDEFISKPINTGLFLTVLGKFLNEN